MNRVRGVKGRFVNLDVDSAQSVSPGAPAYSQSYHQAHRQTMGAHSGIRVGDDEGQDMGVSLGISADTSSFGRYHAVQQPAVQMPAYGMSDSSFMVQASASLGSNPEARNQVAIRAHATYNPHILQPMPEVESGCSLLPEEFAKSPVFGNLASIRMSSAVTLDEACAHAPDTMCAPNGLPEGMFIAGNSTKPEYSQRNQFLVE